MVIQGWTLQRIIFSKFHQLQKQHNIPLVIAVELKKFLEVMIIMVCCTVSTFQFIKFLVTFLFLNNCKVKYFIHEPEILFISFPHFVFNNFWIMNFCIAHHWFKSSQYWLFFWLPCLHWALKFQSDLAFAFKVYLKILWNIKRNFI